MRRLTLAWMSLLGAAWMDVGALARQAPGFQGELLTGEKVSLQTLQKKDRMLLLSFWATWCLPCLEELTHVSQKLKSDPTIAVDLISVNVDKEQRNEIPSTMQQLGFTFPVILDPNQDILGKYHKAATLPFSVLIHPSGEIQEVFSGYHDTMMQKIIKAAEVLRPGKT